MPRRRIFSNCLLWLFLLTPAVICAQDSIADIEAAIASYHAEEIIEATRQLRAILTSPDAERFPPTVISKAYTYLAMCEWAMYRRPETQAAMESAIRTDVKTFVEYARPWAIEHPTITDSVVSAVVTGGVALYDDAEYASSVNEMTLVLPLEDVMDSRLAARIHMYLAFCYVAMRKNMLAHQEFRTALRFHPQLELGDDATIAPKIRRAFLAVRRDALRKSQRSARRNTVLRSLLIPGWGQIYRGSRYKGYGFMAAEFTFITGMFLSIRSYGQARDAYEKFGVADALLIYHRRDSVEDVKLELDARYYRFQSKGARANTMVALAVGVWAANVVDAFILSLRRDRMFTDSNSPSGLAMNWDPVTQQWGLGYQVSW